MRKVTFNLTLITIFVLAIQQETFACFTDFSASIGAATVQYENDLDGCSGSRRCEREARAIYNMNWNSAEGQFDKCMAQK